MFLGLMPVGGAATMDQNSNQIKGFPESVVRRMTATTRGNKDRTQIRNTHPVPGNI